MSKIHYSIEPAMAHANWKGRWWDIINKLNLISDDISLERELLIPLASPKHPITLVFVNAHAMNSIVWNQAFAESLLCADHVLRDGSGMKALLGWVGLKAGLNLNGTDLIPRLIQRYDGRRIALMGTKEPYLNTAAQYVSTYLAPAAQISIINGFQSIDSYERQVMAECPDLIILGMGMPKQEAVAQRLRERVQHPCLIVCGGAILDFMGGKVRRAPIWMRCIGMEWLYRFALEPMRLFKRYVIGNPLFLVRAAVLNLGRRA